MKYGSFEHLCKVDPKIDDVKLRYLFTRVLCYLYIYLFFEAAKMKETMLQLHVILCIINAMFFVNTYIRIKYLPS